MDKSFLAANVPYSPVIALLALMNYELIMNFKFAS
jgi:hypothetical protein